MKKLKESHLLLLGGPRLPFSAQELQDIRRYIEDGGRCMIMMAEGGEQKSNTNINAMLEQVGISVNSDTVIRKTFHKYLHPKEAFIGNGCLNDELVKAANGKAQADEEGNKPGKYSKKYRDTKDDLANRDENGGLKFVYPYGCSINVRKPAQTLLSSGPISFPANRPAAAFYTSPKRGKLMIIGSMQFFSDEFFEKEDN
jgi:intraflagellar transport protein 52